MPDVSPDYKRVVDLMRKMKSKDGHTPLPPGQHRWHKDLEGTTPRQRMWAEVLEGTLARWQNRTDYYAIDDKGTEGHIEHLAAALGMDKANAYRTFKELVARGVLRPGTKQEGKQRIYLRGDVPKEAPPVEDHKPKRDEWPHHIWKVIKDWPAARVATLRARLDFEERLDRMTHADLMAVQRIACAERIDAILESEGIPPARQVHKRKHETEAETAARRERLNGLQTEVQNYVRSLAKFVQSQNFNFVQPKTKSEVSQAKSAQIKPDGGMEQNVLPQSNYQRTTIEIACLPGSVGQEGRQIDSEFVKMLAIRRLLPDDSKFLEKVWNLASSVPMWFFFENLDKRHGKIGPGALLKFAQHQVTAWQPIADAEQQRQATEQRYAAEQQQRYERVARETLSDPRASADEKRMAEELLKDAQSA